MNPKIEAAIESISDWWFDLSPHVQGILIGSVFGFVIGAIVF